jgi:hypothetical protein
MGRIARFGACDRQARSDRVGGEYHRPSYPPVESVLGPARLDSRRICELRQPLLLEVRHPYRLCLGDEVVGESIDVGIRKLLEVICRQERGPSEAFREHGGGREWVDLDGLDGESWFKVSQAREESAKCVRKDTARCGAPDGSSCSADSRVRVEDGGEERSNHVLWRVQGRRVEPV